MKTYFHLFCILRAHPEPPWVLVHKNLSAMFFCPESFSNSVPASFPQNMAAARSLGEGFKLWKEHSFEDIMLHTLKWCQEAQGGGSFRRRKNKKAWHYVGQSGPCRL